MEHYLQRLSEIYNAIDIAYKKAQLHYAFSCEGCADNCCVTRFHHHTVVEELYLAQGLKMLGAEKIKDIKSRAEDVVHIHKTSADETAMCPLNENTLCLIYEYRSMICRVHGVPYKVYKMDSSIEYGAGCYRFLTEKAEAAEDYIINRTPFYLDIARLEKEVREYLNMPGKYKKTTAEMALNIISCKGFVKGEK
ncbi:MAG: hypothetical protein HY755_10050 [Nitrospirae bacterium]|nr:hypothetical protein [Nitrospirota bacterium]